MTFFYRNLYIYAKISCMNKYLATIGLFLITGVLKVDAQASLYADTLTGCGRLEVHFSIIPSPDSDTIGSIVWDFGNGEGESGSLTPSAVYENAGSFHVTATMNGSVTLSLPDSIRVYPDPDPEFFFTDSLEADNFAYVFRSQRENDHSPAFLYHWSFGDGDTATGTDVLHVFNTAGNYRVSLTVSGPAQCTATRSIDLQVNKLLELPNIFTPNGDGWNDYFRVRTNGEEIYSFTVYSRAGMLIYKSESPFIVWDGRSLSGEEMRDGIYYYTISRLNGENGMQKKGFVQLVR